MHFSNTRIPGRIALAPLVLVVMFAAAHAAPAQTETVLYSFGIQAVDGATPWDSLILDKQGNLYGTTEQGGEYGVGEVFMLSPPAKKHGAWMESVLYSFGRQSGDGVSPYDSLVMDKEGNLYGTTNEGGPNNFGTVFKLSAEGGGAWTETVLYGFGGTPHDGSLPFAGLIMDKEGNLYGTTYGGGASNVGTVFELSPPVKKGGAWTETVLYGFGGVPHDGSHPYAGLVIDKAGNLYGTTEQGGAYGFGTVCKLSPPTEKGGAWTETVLYSFGSQSGDGVNPWDSLVMDKKGNLYGTTSGGGAYVYGEVFKLSPPAQESGDWAETLLYSFGSYSIDGQYPFDSLLMDKKGNLYGTTTGGGKYGSGTVFELSPPAGKGDAWTEKLLYTFGKQSNNGEEPWDSLIMDKDGNLYGTTTEGGATNNCDYGCGTVFKLSSE
jgi:uncharacterized repeat protein (TIGR03803 family)